MIWHDHCMVLHSDISYLASEMDEQLSWTVKLLTWKMVRSLNFLVVVEIFGFVYWSLVLRRKKLGRLTKVTLGGICLLCSPLLSSPLLSSVGYHSTRERKSQPTQSLLPLILFRYRSLSLFRSHPSAPLCLSVCSFTLPHLSLSQSYLPHVVLISRPSFCWIFSCFFKYYLLYSNGKFGITWVFACRFVCCRCSVMNMQICSAQHDNSASLSTHTHRMPMDTYTFAELHGGKSGLSLRLSRLQSCWR